MFLKIKSVDLSAGLWVNNAYCALRCAPFWEKECDLNTLRNCIPVRWNVYRTNRSLDTLTNLWNVLSFFCLVACYFLSRCILQPCVMSRCIRQTFGDQFVVSDTSPSQQFSQDTFFFFQLLSSVLARKIMWFSRDAPVVYLHGIQCKLLIFSLWCFNSDFQMINSTKEEISRFWASVTFELFAFISIFSWSRRLTAWTPVPSRRF